MNKALLRLLSITIGMLMIVARCAVVQADNNPRVVSIDGSITEIVYALHAQQKLVAVDTTSRYPAAATELPDVGYMRQLSTEGILALQPDLILASSDAGPEEVFTQLQAAGVTVVRIDNQYSVDGVLNKVRRVAQALGQEAQGKQLTQRIQAQAQQALAAIPPQAAAPRSLFILGAGNRGLMAAGQHTQADAMLRLLKAQNVMHYDGYKPASAEAITEADPQIVLIAHTGPDSGNIGQSIAMTEAARTGRIYPLDTSLILGFGPRIGDALEQLVPLLYPARPVTDGL